MASATRDARQAFLSDDMTSLETERLANFLRASGATVHRELELFGKRGSERGVFATAPIAKGELLLRLPRAAVMTACEDDDECSWMPEEARKTSPMLRVALALLREEGQGKASRWHPYLSTLPPEYDTLEHWSQAELAALEGTSVHDELSGLRDASGDLVGPARVLYDKSIAPVVRAGPLHWPDPSLSAFLRGCAAVRTRGFYDTADGGGGPYMLPAIDMLNHARKGTATSLVVERGGAGDGGKGDGGKAASKATGKAAKKLTAAEQAAAEKLLVFSMHAERDIAAGEEITHTYDQFDNAQLVSATGR